MKRFADNVDGPNRRAQTRKHQRSQVEAAMTRFALLFATTAIVLSLGAAAQADIVACNDFRAPLRVALASERAGGIAAAGWWRVEPNACRDIDFAFTGASLYYAADSDSYRDGGKTYRDHWGNKKELFVPTKDFKTDNADRKQRGAKSVMFSQASLSPQQQAKPLVITFRFSSGSTTTQIKFK